MANPDDRAGKLTKRRYVIRLGIKKNRPDEGVRHYIEKPQTGEIIAEWTDRRGERHVYGPPVVVTVMVQIQALAFQEADGRYSVVVPELPGCATQADDIEDVPAMVTEAAEGWLAAGHDENRIGAIRDVTEPFPSEVGR